jgi:hypothetical protein
MIDIITKGAKTRIHATVEAPDLHIKFNIQVQNNMEINLIVKISAVFSTGH